MIILKLGTQIWCRFIWKKCIVPLVKWTHNNLSVRIFCSIFILAELTTVIITIITTHLPTAFHSSLPRECCKFHFHMQCRAPRRFLQPSGKSLLCWKRHHSDTCNIWVVATCTSTWQRIRHKSGTCRQSIQNNFSGVLSASWEVKEKDYVFIRYGFSIFSQHEDVSHVSCN